MRKEISLVTAIIVSGFLGLALPGCSEDRNNSTGAGDGTKSSGGTTGSKSNPGGGSSSSGTGSGTGTGGSATGSGAVDQPAAVRGEVDHS